jgi:hypothetical protein
LAPQPTLRDRTRERLVRRVPRAARPRLYRPSPRSEDLPVVLCLAETVDNMEPANGFEPLTCALRVRLLGISHNARSLRSLKIHEISRVLRLRRTTKIRDRGECAPRVPQREGENHSGGLPKRRFSAGQKKSQATEAEMFHAVKQVETGLPVTVAAERYGGIRKRSTIGARCAMSNY